MSTATEKAWERFKTNMAPLCVEPASSELATPEPAGPVSSLSCDAIVSCAPSVVQLLDEQRTAFVMWLNADPRNAEENRFWKSRLDEADAKLREAKRTANAQC